MLKKDLNKFFAEQGHMSQALLFQSLPLWFAESIMFAIRPMYNGLVFFFPFICGTAGTYWEFVAPLLIVNRHVKHVSSTKGLVIGEIGRSSQLMKYNVHFPMNLEVLIPYC